MKIRAIEIKDASEYLKMLKQLDTETKNMLFEADERKTTESETRNRIIENSESGSLTLVAEEDGKIVGFLSAERGFANRIRHSAYIVIGILKEYHGRKIGKGFFKELEKWAKDSEITRLELTVMTHNENAVNLYKKMGYEIEGKKLRSLKVDGEYVDEYYMGKILDY